MEKDGTTRIFVHAGASGEVYERYPVDVRRDRSKWLPLGEVAARGDIRLTNSTGSTTTTWRIHPVEEGNSLPFPLEENDEFETGAMDVAAAADEMNQWVGKTGLTIITS
jgi:hypothetical protein